MVAAAAAAASASQGNLPPHDLDAERAVLGGVLLDNSALDTVESIVTPPDFYHPSHAVIFESVQAIKARGEPVDVVTLAAELRARERLNTVGGAQYLGELTDTIPTIAHIEQHARIVADLAQVRRMIAAAHEITARGYGERGNADAFLDFAAAKVFDIAQKRSKSSLIELHQAIQEAFERIEKTLERGARITGASSSTDHRPNSPRPASAWPIPSLPGSATCGGRAACTATASSSAAPTPRWQAAPSPGAG
ncbi:MAG: DnaB-like helicase N-terminal domain-containing protein [Deltaproteobacteria bacterium]